MLQHSLFPKKYKDIVTVIEIEILLCFFQKQCSEYG